MKNINMGEKYSISKYLIKKKVLDKSTEEKLTDLRQQVANLKIQILELAESKKKLDLNRLIQPLSLSQQGSVIVNANLKKNVCGFAVTKLKLKFHEIAGLDITKIKESILVHFIFTTKIPNTDKFFIKLYQKDGAIKFSSCYLPEAIAINDILEEYPLNNAIRTVKVLNEYCQAYWDIKLQLDELEKELAEKNILIFHTRCLRYIALSLPVAYSRTSGQYYVTVGLHFKLPKSRPHQISVECDAMGQDLQRTLKIQFKAMKKYSLVNGFQVATTRNKDSMFYALDHFDYHFPSQTQNPWKGTDRLNYVFNYFNMSINVLQEYIKTRADSSGSSTNIHPKMNIEEHRLKTEPSQTNFSDHYMESSVAEAPVTKSAVVKNVKEDVFKKPVPRPRGRAKKKLNNTLKNKIKKRK